MKSLLLMGWLAIAGAGCGSVPHYRTSTTTTTGSLLCPSGYVPSADARNCELAPLPP